MTRSPTTLREAVLGWIGMLLLPITFPILALAAIGTLLVRPNHARDRTTGIALLVCGACLIYFIAILPGAAVLSLLAILVAGLALLSIIARRSGGRGR